MSSIIFGPFRLLGNTHLFNWLLRWPVGIDMWCRSCRPEARIRRRVREKIRRISNLLKTFEVRTLSNSNANFVTSLGIMPRLSKHTSCVIHTWMVKVKLSPACCCPLALVQHPVEAFLTDNRHTSTVLLVGGVLVKSCNDLLTYSRLAQHHTTST